MSAEPSWASARPSTSAGARELEVGVDVDRANVARMYDYFLGGAHHFAVDRKAAAAVLRANSDTVEVARAMRSWLARAVSWCVARGLDQFLDLGSGIAAVGSVHEIARRAAPHARVAYVDVEPVAVAHHSDVLGGIDGVSITRADVCDPDAVLAAPGVSELLDFTRPVGVLAGGVLHFLDDEDLSAAICGYRAALAPGSALVLNHVSDDYDDPDLVARIRAGTAAYQQTATPARVRSRSHLLGLLRGLDLAPPGLVDVTAWPRPPSADPAARVLFAGVLAGVALVPATSSTCATGHDQQTPSAPSHHRGGPPPAPTPRP